MIILDEVDSTQAELKRRLEKNADLEEGFSVQAKQQSAGRGRHQREWFSPIGNLYFSVLLRGLHQNVTWLPHRVALAIAKTLVEVGLDPRRLYLKWPNDLVIDREFKLAGVICEKIGDHVIAGIGLNVLSSPTLKDRKTISLKEVGGVNLNLEQIKNGIIEKAKEGGGFSKMKSQYEAFLLFKKNDPIQWQNETTQKIHFGKFLRIGDYGELQVQEGDTVGSLYSEDVSLIK